MSLTDAQRRQIHAAFERAFGANDANLVMEKVLPPVDWSDLAREASTAARFDRVDGRFDRVDARFDKVDARLDKVDAKFDKVDAQSVAVRGEMAELRAEVHRLAVYGILAAGGASIMTAVVVLGAMQVS